MIPVPNRRGRRRCLGLLAAGAAAPALAVPARPVAGFAAGDLGAALRALYGDRTVLDSDAVDIDVVSIAEDGAIVPVRIAVAAVRVRAIALFAERNPAPLIGVFELDPSLEPYLATRVKLGETGDLLVVADTGAGLLGARRHVRVVIGGCA